MITTSGKNFIKRSLAGQSGAAVGAISIGIGNAAASLSDTRMQFEFARVPVEVTDYDFVADKLVFKGTLDETVEGTIYEIGLWTSEVTSAAGNQEGRIITTFDSLTEDWSVETFDAANTRIGADSLKQTPAANATSSSILSGITYDLSDFSSLDVFTLAYYVGNANTQSVSVRFRTDAANYYEFVITSPTAGYKFEQLQKGLASVTGTPDWLDINEVEIRTTAKAGGAAAVQFDGIRIEDTDSVSSDYGLVARHVLATPEVKAEGTVQDFEYALTVNIS